MADGDSFWDKFGSNIVRGLGYAGAGAAFATGAGAAAPYIISGADAVASGMDKNNAIDKASGQLQDANTQSRDVINQGTQQALGAFNGAYSPYLTLGSQSANTLGGLFGFDMTPQPMQTGGGAPMASGAPVAAPTPYATRVRPDDSPVIGHAIPRGSTLADLAQESGQAQTRSSFVRMRAPDGTEEDVPQAQARHFMDLGAEMVGQS